MDRLRATYARTRVLGELARLVGPVEVTCAIPDAVLDRYLANEVDLLGSGWVNVSFVAHCRGLEGHAYATHTVQRPDAGGEWLNRRISPANLVEAKRIWRLIDEGYQPVDWHRDFKSGFRWPEGVRFDKVRFAPRTGVDVKVPWELARMQHLPQLAVAFAAGDGRRKELARTFRNQVLDFVATNPPRFGVNWASTMDVAIRVANWLVAYDIFQCAGAVFDPPFSELLVRSVYEHGQHIVENLEWYGGIRSNHYLANIAGLAFVAAYLPRSTEADRWLAFSALELIKEVGHQFHVDGSNFEGATCYHRLSLEMVVYATAVLARVVTERLGDITGLTSTVALGKPRVGGVGKSSDALSKSTEQPAQTDAPFPAWYYERIARALDFMRAVTKPNGRLHQIGDNDSGRFVKLAPVFLPMSVSEAKRALRNLDGYVYLPDEADYWLEDTLDSRHIFAAAKELFGQQAQHVWRDLHTDPLHPDAVYVRRILGGARRGTWRADAEAGRGHAPTCAGESLARILAELPSDPSRTRVTEFPVGEQGIDIRVGLGVLHFPEFGLVVFRSDELYLAVICREKGWSGPQAHLHSDQLAVELAWRDADIVRDPGSYLYTPLPGLRNAYRSVDAHFTPLPPGNEPSSLEGGLFAIQIVPARLRYLGALGFAGEIRVDGSTFLRVVTIEAERVTVTDHAPLGGFEPDGAQSASIGFSPGYGVCLRCGS